MAKRQIVRRFGGQEARQLLKPAERRTRALERANDIEMGHVARHRAQPDALGRRLPAFVSSTSGHLRGPVDPQRQTDRRALR